MTSLLVTSSRLWILHVITYTLILTILRYGCAWDICAGQINGTCETQGVGNSDGKGCGDINSDRYRRDVKTDLFWCNKIPMVWVENYDKRQVRKLCHKTS